MLNMLLWRCDRPHCLPLTETAIKDLDIGITIFRELCEDVEKKENEVCLVKKMQYILPRTCEVSIIISKVGISQRIMKDYVS